MNYKLMGKGLNEAKIGTHLKQTFKKKSMLREWKTSKQNKQKLPSVFYVYWSNLLKSCQKALKKISIILFYTESLKIP